MNGAPRPVPRQKTPRHRTEYGNRLYPCSTGRYKRKRYPAKLSWGPTRFGGYKPASNYGIRENVLRKDENARENDETSNEN